jgi:hypothetical protein
VYRVKNAIGQLTNRGRGNIIVDVERVPLKYGNIIDRKRKK